nr:VOC family protein [Petrachloros mirabilis]
MSIRTANIHRAIAFYNVLGFRVEARFTTGETLACWLMGEAGRLELIQIPEPRPAADAFGDPHYVGYYHLSFDVTADLGATESLGSWLQSLQTRLADQSLFLKVLLPPTSQQIGDRTYEVAFIADTDFLPIELLCEPTSS